MIGFTEQMTQKISLPVASIPPSNAAAGNSSTSAINMSNFRRIMGHLTTGVLGASANIQLFFQSSNTLGGAYANIANGPVATVSSSNVDATIEMRADQLPTGNQFVKLVATVNTAASNFAATALCSDSHYSPANQFDGNTNVIATRVVM